MSWIQKPNIVVRTAGIEHSNGAGTECCGAACSKHNIGAGTGQYCTSGAEHISCAGTQNCIAKRIDRQVHSVCVVHLVRLVCLVHLQMDNLRLLLQTDKRQTPVCMMSKQYIYIY